MDGLDIGHLFRTGGETEVINLKPEAIIDIYKAKILKNNLWLLRRIIDELSKDDSVDPMLLMTLTMIFNDVEIVKDAIEQEVHKKPFGEDIALIYKEEATDGQA